MVKENRVNLYDVDDWGYNNDDNEDYHDDDEVEKKKDGGVGEGSCQREKQLKLDQRTADIRSFLVKVTRISVNRCTRLK